MPCCAPVLLRTRLHLQECGVMPEHRGVDCLSTALSSKAYRNALPHSHLSHYDWNKMAFSVLVSIPASERLMRFRDPSERLMRFRMSLVTLICPLVTERA